MIKNNSSWQQLMKNFDHFENNLDEQTAESMEDFFTNSKQSLIDGEYDEKQAMKIKRRMEDMHDKVKQMQAELKRQSLELTQNKPYHHLYLQRLK